MSKQTRSIFRADAIRQYTARKEKAVLPKLVRPSVFWFLWIFVGLLLACTLLGWSVEMPVRAPALVMVMDRRNIHQTIADEATVLVLVPPEHQSELKAGQRLLVRMNNEDATTDGKILQTEPDVLSPKSIQDRFGVTGGAAAKI